MDYATGSDPLLAAAVRIGAGALVVSIALLFAILWLRLRLIARLAHERRFAARWQPLFAACAVEIPEALPELAPADGPLFLSHWLRAQESLRGDAQQNLNALAARAGADRLAVGYLASGSARLEMLALVAAGHLRLTGIWPLAESLAAHAPPVIALTAAQALLRIDSVRALPRVLVLAAAIDAEREAAPQGPGLPRLLRLLGAVAAEAARPAVRAALEGVDRPDVAAAALDTLWNPEDAPLARARLAHAEWYVRLAAVKALGRVGAAGDRDALEDRLSDENWWVRYRAAQALARLPGVSREALAALRAASTDRYAADMLGQVLAEMEGA